MTTAIAKTQTKVFRKYENVLLDTVEDSMQFLLLTAVMM